ncbi:hypothetical protein BC628DRAFT_1398348 [Trametes gibbosa]|nr:hypothetical protein BC628DRAFT_1398348 [Trametes gibbosa]
MPPPLALPRYAYRFAPVTHTSAPRCLGSPDNPIAAYGHCISYPPLPLYLSGPVLAARHAAVACPLRYAPSYSIPLPSPHPRHPPVPMLPALTHTRPCPIVVLCRCRRCRSCTLHAPSLLAVASPCELVLCVCASVRAVRPSEFLRLLVCPSVRSPAPRSLFRRETSRAGRVAG